jgi:hypothetical protein
MFSRLPVFEIRFYGIVYRNNMIGDQMPLYIIAQVVKNMNVRGGACSAQSGHGKQRPYTKL